MEATPAVNQDANGQPSYPRIDPLPPRLQRMLTEKRKAREQWQRLRVSSLKTQYNKLSEKLRIEMKEYRKSPEMWRRRHKQRPVTPQPAANPVPRAAKYPTIVVETFPNLARHLKNLAEQFGSSPYAICRNSQILFIPRDGPEYHAVIKYLKSIEVAEPGCKYVVRPLSVCIRGIPSSISTDDVKTACIDRGYLVDHIKWITNDLCYVKLCGGKDNTKILEMRELFSFKVRVELWKSGPVKREPEEVAASSTSNISRNGVPALIPPPLKQEHLAVQSTGLQAANNEETSTAKYPAIVVDNFPNWPKHLENIKEDFGRPIYADAWFNGLCFVNKDGPEYHAVIRYLKSIEATEPELKYSVRSLDVCIYGLPSSISIEDIKTACTERGYLVDHVKLIVTSGVRSLHYVRICGRKDNTSILQMRDLLGFRIKVELWRGGPVKKEKQPKNQPISATCNTETSSAPVSTIPEPRVGQLAGLVAQSARTQAPAVPLPRPEQPVLAGQSAGNQTQILNPMIAGMTREQFVTLTTHILVEVFQAFNLVQLKD